MGLARAAAGGGGALVVLGLPFLLGDYGLHLLVLVCMYVTLSSSWNILTLAGQLTLGHAGFFGVGAYTSALLALRLGVPIAAGMLAGALAAAGLAAAVGVVCLRLRGVYLAIATLSLVEALRIVVLNFPEYTEGSIGITLPPVFGGARGPAYFSMLAVAVLPVLATVWIKRSKLHVVFGAIREDQGAAEMLGINTTAYKVLAFALSASFAGLAGGFYPHYLTYIVPDSAFAIGLSIEAQIMPILGGLYTVAGPVVGAVVLTLVGEYLRTTFGAANLFVYGLAMIVVILCLPDGLMGLLRRRWRAAPPLVPAAQPREGAADVSR
ncbi:MAG: branched-chain amino acid ABC transporter permease [Candidatus Rokubacteria bacterium]|nr:branched-chain amino acid ABC transporter permease [Candidatus Rokubacteria bacterium]